MQWARDLLFFAALLLGSARHHQDEGPVVKLRGLGEVEGVVEETVTKFLGVPYAEAPIGKLRWKSLVPVEPWRGVKSCKLLPKRCIEIPEAGDKPFEHASEDCLVVNIYKPTSADVDSKLPVLSQRGPSKRLTGRTRGSEPCGTGKQATSSVECCAKGDGACPTSYSPTPVQKARIVEFWMLPRKLLSTHELSWKFGAHFAEEPANCTSSSLSWRLLESLRLGTFSQSIVPSRAARGGGVPGLGLS